MATAAPRQRVVVTGSMAVCTARGRCGWPEAPAFADAGAPVACSTASGRRGRPQLRPVFLVVAISGQPLPSRSPRTAAAARAVPGGGQRL